MADKTTPRDGRKPFQSDGGAIIRPLAAKDRQAIRDICCTTAYRNKGHDLLFEDREVHADYWTKYYTDYHPEDSWVLEQDGAVVGYFLGCTDQLDFLKTMSRRIVPSCILRGLFRMLTWRYKKKQSGRYLRHMILYGAKEAPDIPAKDFPSHYHCNILKTAQGKRYYSEMGYLFFDRLKEKGVTHLMAGATEPKTGGFYSRCFKLLQEGRDMTYDEKPTRLFEAVLGDKRPMVNRAWGVSVEDYCEFMTLMREKFSI